MYDVCSRASFAKLDNWLNELETFTTKHDIVKMLVGNKIDKVGVWFYDILRDLSLYQEPREVSREEGLKFARRYHMLFIEASAKTKEGVQCAFEELVEKVR